MLPESWGAGQTPRWLGAALRAEAEVAMGAGEAQRRDFPVGGGGGTGL